MEITLSKKTAQKIVETVKDVCGYNINYINKSGIIFASTDEKRIGEYHEIGRKVAETGTVIEVETDDDFQGTNKGVNIPFFYKKELIAVIGISGQPDNVRKYAVLAQKITALLLREMEMESLDYGKKSQISYVIHALIENKDIHHDLLMESLADHHLSTRDICRTIIVKWNSGYDKADLSSIENSIYRAFDQMRSSIHTFSYPNEYWMIVADREYTQKKFVLKKLAEEHREILRIGIGSAEPFMRQHISYTSAGIALNSLTTQDNMVCYDDLSLDILFGSIPKTATAKYLDKVLTGLTDREDLRLLEVYFECNMSLKETAELLYLHKNTLQYKLNRIQRMTGLNPRSFKDAVLLYMGICLRRYAVFPPDGGEE